MQHSKILILDFGSQVTQLIARRVREMHVYCEVHPCDVSDDWVRQYAADGRLKGVILSGSHASAYEESTDRAPQAVFELGVPVLGICYGMQTMAQQLGGKVEGGHLREFGYAEVRARGHTALLKDIADFTTPEGHGMLKVWMSHGDKVTQLPPGFKLMASTDSCPIAGMADEARRFYAVQFHPEVTHTVQGRAMLERFVLQICGAEPDWVMRDHVAEAVEAIRQQVGDEEVILGLSGGVDSSVAAALIHRAIGDQLTCVFVDHGLMRMNEAEQVVEDFQHFGIPLVHVDAEERFLSKLAGVTDPETKRKIIGEEFIRVFEEEAAKIEGADFLVQGALYSDVIESGGSDHAATIKSHHNVGGLPEDLQFELVEPLRMLFKDEVRAVGTELELPDRMVWRQPFPGPGLGIRIVGGEVNRERLDILRQADHILHEEVGGANMYRELWQFFCVLPVIRSVGVQGDGRTYAYPVVIRAVTSKDAMTADWARIPYDVLEKVSNRIINEVSGVNRVAYDITSKPPGTIEWE